MKGYVVENGYMGYLDIKLEVESVVRSRGTRYSLAASTISGKTGRLLVTTSAGIFLEKSEKIRSFRIVGSSESK